MEKNLNDLVTYSVTDAYLEQIKKDYLALKVSDVDDKEGYELCNNARKEVKDRRILVEVRRKELKKDSLAFGARVDAEARRIREQLEAVEKHLKAQQDVVDSEKKRLKEEAEQKVRDELNRRIQVMQGYKATFVVSELSVMSKEQFEGVEFKAKTEFEAAEKKRIDDEKRLADLQKDNDEKDRKIKAQDIENQRLKDEQAARDKKALDEKDAQLKKERDDRAAEDRKREEDDRLRQEEADKKRKEEEDRKADDDRKKKEEDDKKQQEEDDRHQKAEAEISNKKMFNQIKEEFTTLESAWVEIARLRKLQKGGK